MRYRKIGTSLAVVGWLLAAGPVLAECSREGVDSASTVVALESPLGEICIELFDTAAPKTVENFLDYLDRGEIDDTFIHRSVPGFVIQGGGYREVGGVHESVPARADVVLNESCALDTPVSEGSETLVCSTRGNQRGTLSLAKLGGDPNSGTTNWFINLADNRVNLDNANGGYTVFGRVFDDDLSVVDAIAGLPMASMDPLMWRNSPVIDVFMDGNSGFSWLPLLSNPSMGPVGDGCFDGASLTVVVEPEPDYVTVVTDPSDPARWFLLSGSCGIRVAPEAFVPEPASGDCAQGSLLGARITFGSNFTGFLVQDVDTEEFIYDAFSCEAAETVVAERSEWKSEFDARFDAELVTISSAVRVPEPGWGLGGLTVLVALAGLRRVCRARA